jgi:hypothetical protein
VNQLYPQTSHSNHSSRTSSPLPTPPLFDPDPQRLYGHIADAYNHWNSLADKQRQEAWQLELLRAHAKAIDLRREAEMNLENAKREIEFLKSSRWSSGAPDVSPIVVNISSDASKELGKHCMDFRNWDYDRLIEKWKSFVREGKSASGGLAAQKPLPDSGARSCSMVNLPTQSFSIDSTNQDVKMISTFTAPPTVNGTEPGSDQLDAEGEDDDGVDLDAEAASDEGSVGNAPHHGLPLQPTPIHPPQMQNHAQLQPQVHHQQQMQFNQQAQAHAQAQMQAQQQAQAQAQAQAWARQHMNQSRNSHHHPHQHQQLSPHPSHMGSAGNSRRTSQVMMDPHNMNPNTMSANGMLPMDGIDAHQDQFLRMGMMADQFVGTAANGV